MQKKFILHTPPLVKISFLTQFADNFNQQSILSIVNSTQLWKGNPVYIISRNSTIAYDGLSYNIITIQIPFPAMANEVNGYLHAERIAKYNNTIVFYEHGTFQAVYDFRKQI